MQLDPGKTSFRKYACLVGRRKGGVGGASLADMPFRVEKAAPLQMAKDLRREARDHNPKNKHASAHNLKNKHARAHILKNTHAQDHNLKTNYTRDHNLEYTHARAHNPKNKHKRAHNLKKKHESRPGKDRCQEIRLSSWQA